MSESLSGPERIVFVGGAPRSGTTLTYALLCTADEVGEYSREISFYRGLVQSFATGLSVWDVHTYAYFDSRDSFRLLFRDLSKQALRPVWEAVGRPRVLCVKDPNLTPLFPAIADMLEDARFVTVARSPEDVVRSRMQVHELSAGPGSFTKEQALAVAHEYLDYYMPVLSTDFGDRHLSFRYDQINKTIVLRALARHIGVPGFNADRLWDDLKPIDPNDPWGSPKFGKAIDTSSRFAPLPQDWVENIYRVTAPVAERYNFKPR
jgi:hypothetical protein